MRDRSIRWLAGVVLPAMLSSLVLFTPTSAQALVLRPRATKVAGPTIHGTPFNVYAHAQAPRGASTAGTRTLPTPRKVSASTYKAWKTSAAHAASAPAVAPRGAGTSSAASSAALPSFAGMQDSPAVCPPSGCQPPDMALAASPDYVLQGVNTAFQLFSPSGQSLQGPIDAQHFFGVPNLPNDCDPLGVFLSDPRAFYDPNTHRMWAAILQVENFDGIAPRCPFQTTYWIANFDPASGQGCVYSVDMSLGTTNVADYTKIGFNGDTVAWSGDMFNQQATRFEYEEAMFASKSRMQRCLDTTTTAFTHFRVGGGRNGRVLVDNVQPVLTETTAANDPGVLFLANSFNAGPGEGDPFGDDCFFTACRGFVTWAYSPGTASLSGTVVLPNVPRASYLIPPNADQPSCQQCVETIDTRMTANPVYSVASGTGLISFAIGTAADNGSGMNVPAVLWGEIQPRLSNNRIYGGTLYQSGYIVYAGDRAASFGATMQGKGGRLVVLFDTMSATINPGYMVADRWKSDPLGSLGSPRFIKRGTGPTDDFRWGDYEALSYTGSADDGIWVSSQYSIGDWATWIAKV